MTRTGIACLLAAAAVPSGAAFQQPQFRTRVDLVQVDVVVTDRRGNPVSGLTAGDFTIVEYGRPQTISQFEAFTVPLGERHVDRRSTAAARDVITNAGPPSPRAVAIVIDSLHLSTDAEELERQRRALVGMLTDISSRDDVAIVFTGRSDLSVPFTRDLARQIRAIDRIKEAAIVRARRSSQEAIFDVRRALWTVRNVISVLKDSPHSRRALVYVGEGSVEPLYPPNAVLDEVRMTVEAATRAGVVIYAIDPRGMLDAYERSVQRIQRDFLSAIVLDTGGAVVAGAGDTRGEIRRVIRENGVFYVLGYVPEPLRRDGRFHPIEVKVRNPEWHVRARKGYYAPPRADAAAATAAEPAAAIESALEGGVPLSGVALSAVAAPVAPGADGKVRTLLTISIEAAGADADWDLAILAMTPDGKVQSTTTERVQTAGAPDTHILNRTIDVAPGVRPLRIVVRNRESGAIGSLHIPLEVPDLHDERLSMGGLMIGVLREGSASNVPTPGFEPSTGRDFEAGDAPVLLAHIFWRPDDAREVEVTAAITRGGGEFERTRGVVSGSAIGRVQHGAFRWPLPLGSLAPGEYEVRVTAQHGRRRVSGAVPFRVR